jgi:hypothetical protein
MFELSRTDLVAWAPVAAAVVATMSTLLDIK